MRQVRVIQEDFKTDTIIVIVQNLINIIEKCII